MSKIYAGDIMFNFIILIIVIVGAINWFCIGVFQFDLIAGIFGTQAHFASRFIYTVIGLAGFWLLAYTLIKKGQLSLLPLKSKKKKDNKDKMDTTTNESDSAMATPNTATQPTATNETQLNQDTSQAINQALNGNKQIDTIILTNHDAVSTANSSPPTASQKTTKSKKKKTNIDKQ